MCRMGQAQVECFALAPADRSMYLSRSGDLKFAVLTGSKLIPSDILLGLIKWEFQFSSCPIFVNYSIAVRTPITSILCFSSNVNHFPFLTLIFANCNLYRQLNVWTNLHSEVTSNIVQHFRSDLMRPPYYYLLAHLLVMMLRKHNLVREVIVQDRNVYLTFCVSVIIITSGVPETFVNLWNKTHTCACP